jgi:hypothetical protein
VPDTSGSIDLSTLSEEEKAAVENLAQERGGPAEEPEERRALTAFLVVVGLDGNPEVLSFNDPNLNLLTGPTPDLIYAAAQTIAKDFLAMETARATAEVMQQHAMALQQQMQDQMLQRQVQQGLKKGGR